MSRFCLLIILYLLNLHLEQRDDVWQERKQEYGELSLAVGLQAHHHYLSAFLRRQVPWATATIQ